MVRWLILPTAPICLSHAIANRSSSERFKVMEHKLFYYIMTPAGILALVFGFWFMITRWSYFTQQNWMHAKLIMVCLLWIFHELREIPR